MNGSSQMELLQVLPTFILAFIVTGIIWKQRRRSRPNLNSLQVTVQVAGELVYNFIWMIGLMTIMIYTSNHWPDAYWIAASAILVVFCSWYAWKFVIQPFRS